SGQRIARPGDEAGWRCGSVRARIGHRAHATFLLRTRSALPRACHRQVELRVQILERGQLYERRQLVQTPQAEILEEIPCRAEQLGPPGQVAVPDDANPLALEQGLDDVRVDGHAALGLDLCTR